MKFKEYVAIDFNQNTISFQDLKWFGGRRGSLLLALLKVD